MIASLLFYKNLRFRIRGLARSSDASSTEKSACLSLDLLHSHSAQARLQDLAANLTTSLNEVVAVSHQKGGTRDSCCVAKAVGEALDHLEFCNLAKRQSMGAGTQTVLQADRLAA